MYFALMPGLIDMQACAWPWKGPCKGECRGLIEDALSQILQTLEFCDVERQQPLIELYQQLAILVGHEQIALLMDESTQVQMRDVQQQTCLVLSPEYPLYVTH